MKTTQAGSSDRYSRNEAGHNDDDFFAGLSGEALEELSKAWRRLTPDDLKRMVDLAQE